MRGSGASLEKTSPSQLHSIRGMSEVALSARQTAAIAKPISGDQLYQERAREAFPILVRQAEANKQLTYGALADELGMPNPRNLNHVLGSIGRSIQLLSKKWKEPIPPLQCLVINKATGMPGEGIDWFLKDWGFKLGSSTDDRRLAVKGAHSRIYTYPRWREVLEALELEPIEPDYTDLTEAAAQLPLPHGKGGESDAHRFLKEYVARNPGMFRLPLVATVSMEKRLPSGDSLDVFFCTRRSWTAIEVKSEISNDAEIVRGR